LAGVLFVRSIFRFVLVDAIVEREVRFRQSLRETRRQGFSYFRWLLAAVVGVSLGLFGGGMLVYPHLHAAAAGGMRSAGFWALLVAILVVDILVGLAVALVIVLTDDFVVPIMYAERLPLATAWGRLAVKLRGETAAFAIYVAVRFAVALATSIATLLLLFPLLLGLFSGAVISGALVVLVLHLLGFLWAWNVVTVGLTVTGFALLTSLMLALLSVVGMPAQVFIQDFGIRFAASRFSSIEDMLQPVAVHSGSIEESADVAP